MAPIPPQVVVPVASDNALQARHNSELHVKARRLVSIVICSAIAAGTIGIISGVFYMLSEWYAVGGIEIGCAILLIICGGCGAKNRNRTLLAVYAAITAIIAVLAVVALVFNIIALVVIGGMDDDKFADEHPSSSSKGAYITLGVISIIVSVLMIIFWIMSAYYASVLRNVLKSLTKEAAYPVVQQAPRTQYPPPQAAAGQQYPPEPAYHSGGHPQEVSPPAFDNPAYGSDPAKGGDALPPV